jgi:hypothetical protein
VYAFGELGCLLVQTIGSGVWLPKRFSEVHVVCISRMRKQPEVGRCSFFLHNLEDVLGCIDAS